MNMSAITISPNILSGTPVFCNTRVPVKNLFDYLETGETVDDFLDDFPTVARGQVLQVLESAGNLMTSPECMYESSVS